MTAAYLHILGDLLLSVGVVASSIVIYIWPTEQYPWSKYFDPACTLVFSIIICYTCKDVLTSSVFILMEGAPTAVNTIAMIEDMKKVDKVKSVSEFHCWSLSKGKYYMSAHVKVTGEPMKVLKEVTKIVNDFGVE